MRDESDDTTREVMSDEDPLRCDLADARALLCSIRPQVQHSEIAASMAARRLEKALAQVHAAARAALDVAENAIRERDRAEGELAEAFATTVPGQWSEDGTFSVCGEVDGDPSGVALCMGRATGYPWEDHRCTCTRWPVAVLAKTRRMDELSEADAELEQTAGGE